MCTATSYTWVYRAQTWATTVTRINKLHRAQEEMERNIIEARLNDKYLENKNQNHI